MAAAKIARGGGTYSNTKSVTSRNSVYGNTTSRFVLRLHSWNDDLDQSLKGRHVFRIQRLLLLARLQVVLSRHRLEDAPGSHGRIASDRLCQGRKDEEAILSSGGDVGMEVAAAERDGSRVGAVVSRSRFGGAPGPEKQFMADGRDVPSCGCAWCTGVWIAWIICISSLRTPPATSIVDETKSLPSLKTTRMSSPPPTV